MTYDTFDLFLLPDAEKILKGTPHSFLVSQKFCAPRLTGAAEILRPEIDWCHRNSAPLD